MRSLLLTPFVQAWDAYRNYTAISSGKMKRAATTDNAPKELYIHGFLFDIETFLVSDLNISIGLS